MHEFREARSVMDFKRKQPWVCGMCKLRFRPSDTVTQPNGSAWFHAFCASGGAQHA